MFLFDLRHRKHLTRRGLFVYTIGFAVFGHIALLSSVVKDKSTDGVTVREPPLQTKGWKILPQKTRSNFTHSVTELCVYNGLIPWNTATRRIDKCIFSLHNSAYEQLTTLEKCMSTYECLEDKCDLFASDFGKICEGRTPETNYKGKFTWSWEEKERFIRYRNRIKSEKGFLQ